MRTLLRWSAAPGLLGATVAVATSAPAAPSSPPRQGDDAAPRAARMEVTDPRERNPLLDVREVDSTPDGRRLRFTIVTWSPWRVGAVRDRGYLVVHVDTLDAPGFDYYVLVRSRGRRLAATLFRVRARMRDARVGRVRAWRPDRVSSSVRVPRARVDLAGPRADYSWYVQTLVTSERCKRVCIDRVPDRDGAREPLPPPAPTPPALAPGG